MAQAPVPAEFEELLRRAYAAFNARDVDAALARMHPDVDWPNMLPEYEGAIRLHGQMAVRDYWEWQFARIDVHADPQNFALGPDGSVATEVHQIVRDRDSNVSADRLVRHVYRFQDGLVSSMDVRQA